MLKDFVKLETFLTVARERSFSKASAKLGISQPAVTQQIKFIEKYLAVKIIERKKNGIKLTNEGEELYKIAARIEKEIHASEKDILKIINKEIIFKLGASYTIGTYVITGHCLNTIGKAINNDIKLSIATKNAVVIVAITATTAKTIAIRLVKNCRNHVKIELNKLPKMAANHGIPANNAIGIRL